MAREPAIPGPLGRRPSAIQLSVRRNIEPLVRLGIAALPRALDVLLSLFCLTLLAPFFLIRMAYARLRYKRVFEEETVAGRYHVCFSRLYFSGPAWGRGWPVLINILRGDMSFVGPRPVSEQEGRILRDVEGLRFAQRPGLVSPYTIRQKVGIAYEGERRVEREHYYSETASGNLAVLGRSLVSSALSGDSSLPTPDEIDFFGVRVFNTTMDEAVEWLIKRALDATPSHVAFVNPDCLNIAYRNPDYRRVLQEASRVLPDGIGLRLGCRLFGVSLKANVNGTDLFPRLCEQAAARDVPIFLLGARPGIAALAGENLVRRFPMLRVAGTHHGYFNAEDEDHLIQAINASGAKILIVAFGAPRQELWLNRHHGELQIPVRVGVGGLLDFYSGRMPRAPQWMREIGLEWAFRLSREPGRLWRRYVIGNPLFLYRVWLQSRSMP
jgi:N-acetylglucosaminyldiphosphoundecaprenol N-acetyl-beta-D-mannosaminyltransferase